MPFIYHVQSTLTVPYWQILLLPKPICNCKVNTHGVLGVVSTIVANVFIHHPMHVVLGKVGQAIWVQPSCCKQGPLCCLFTVMLHFFGGWGSDFAVFKMAPNWCAEMLCCPAFLWARTLWHALQRKHMLEKLCSGMSYSAVTSAIVQCQEQGVFKQKRTWNIVMRFIW